MFRPTASIGDGSLVAAVRLEGRNGILTGGKSHIQKAKERIKNLENILAKENLSATERKIANDLTIELKRALNRKQIGGIIIITVDVFTKRFLELFPEYRASFFEHVEYNEELLPHVFFDEILYEDLPKLIRIGREEILQKFFEFLECMLKEGDINVQEVITVTILARLGDEPDILEKSLNYMGIETRKASKEIEAF